MHSGHLDESSSNPVEDTLMSDVNSKDRQTPEFHVDSSEITDGVCPDTSVPVVEPVPVALVVNENFNPPSQINCLASVVAPELAPVSLTDGSLPVSPSSLVSQQTNVSSQPVQIQYVFPENDRFSVQVSNLGNTVQPEFSNNVPTTSVPSMNVLPSVPQVSTSSSLPGNKSSATDTTRKARRVTKKDPNLLTFGDLIDSDISSFDFFQSKDQTSPSERNESNIESLPAISGVANGIDAVVNSLGNSTATSGNRCTSINKEDVVVIHSDKTCVNNIFGSGPTHKEKNYPPIRQGRVSKVDAGQSGIEYVVVYPEEADNLRYETVDVDRLPSDKHLQRYKYSYRANRHYKLPIKHNNSVNNSNPSSDVVDKGQRENTSLDQSVSANVQTRVTSENARNHVVHTQENPYFTYLNRKKLEKQNRKELEKQKTTWREKLENQKKAYWEKLERQNNGQNAHTTAYGQQKISSVAPRLREKIISARTLAASVPENTVTNTTSGNMRGATENMDDENSFDSLGMIIQCAVCLKDFQSLTALEDHMSAHDFTLSNIEVDEGAEKGSSVVCTKCGECLSSETQMTKHKACCPGEKKNRVEFKHVCSECGCKYKSRDELLEHSKHHSYGSTIGEEQQESHMCVDCGEFFTDIATLTAHIESHNSTDVTPEIEVYNIEEGYGTVLEKSDNRMRWEMQGSKKERVSVVQRGVTAITRKCKQLKSKAASSGKYSQRVPHSVQEGDNRQSKGNATRSEEIIVERQSLCSQAKNRLMNPWKGKQKHSRIDDRELLRKFGMTNVKVCLKRIQDMPQDTDREENVMLNTASLQGKCYDSLKGVSRGYKSFKTRSQQNVGLCSTEKGEELIDLTDEDKMASDQISARQVQKMAKANREDQEVVKKKKKCLSDSKVDHKLEEKIAIVEKSQTLSKNKTDSDTDMLRKFGIKDVSICVDKLTSSGQGLKLKSVSYQKPFGSVNEVEEHLQLPWVVLKESDIPDKYKSLNTIEKQVSSKETRRDKSESGREQKVNKFKELSPDELDKLLRECGMGISVPWPAQSPDTVKVAPDHTEAPKATRSATVKRSPSPQPSTSKGRTVGTRKRTARKSIPDQEMIQKYKLKEPRVVVKSMTKIEISLLKNPHSSFGKSSWLRHKFDSDTDSEGDWDIPELEANLEEEEEDFFDLDMPVDNVLEQNCKNDESASNAKTNTSFSKLSDDDLLKKFGMYDVKVVIESPQKSQTTNSDSKDVCPNSSKELFKSDDKTLVKNNLLCKKGNGKRKTEGDEVNTEFIGKKSKQVLERRKCFLRRQQIAHKSSEKQISDVGRIVKRKAIEALRKMVPSPQSKKIKGDIKIDVKNKGNSGRRSQLVDKSSKPKECLSTKSSKASNVVASKKSHCETDCESSRKYDKMLKDMPKVKVSVSCLSNSEIAKYVTSKESAIKETVGNDKFGTEIFDHTKENQGEVDNDCEMEIENESEGGCNIGNTTDNKTEVKLEIGQPKIETPRSEEEMEEDNGNLCESKEKTSDGRVLSKVAEQEDTEASRTDGDDAVDINETAISGSWKIVCKEDVTDKTCVLGKSNAEYILENADEDIEHVDEEDMKEHVDEEQIVENAHKEDSIKNADEEARSENVDEGDIYKNVEEKEKQNAHDEEITITNEEDIDIINEEGKEMAEKKSDQAEDIEIGDEEEIEYAHEEGITIEENVKRGSTEKADEEEMIEIADKENMENPDEKEMEHAHEENVDNANKEEIENADEEIALVEVKEDDGEIENSNSSEDIDVVNNELGDKLSYDAVIVHYESEIQQDTWTEPGARDVPSSEVLDDDKTLSAGTSS